MQNLTYSRVQPCQNTHPEFKKLKVNKYSTGLKQPETKRLKNNLLTKYCRVVSEFSIAAAPLRTLTSTLVPSGLATSAKGEVESDPNVNTLKGACVNKSFQLSFSCKHLFKAQNYVFIS